MRLLLTFLAFVAPAIAAINNSPVDPAAYSRPVRVTCVGDSITAGFALATTADTYPFQLGKMLGLRWAVSNFGGSGANALKNGVNPYYLYPQFADALDSDPDVVVIMLGANDANAANWPKSSEFKEDYRWLIRQFRALPSNPRVFICRPCFAVSGNSFGIINSNILLEIPWINELADEESTGLIDNQAITQANPSEMPDGVHPNTKGAARIAENTFHSLTGEDFPANVSIRATKGKVSLSWYVHQASTPYTVRRSTTPGGPYSPISTNNTTGSHTDLNAPVGSTYYYSLSTTNIYGAVATSPEIAVPMTEETGLLNRTTGGTPSAVDAFDGLDTTDWSSGDSGQTATLQYDHGTYTHWAITSYLLTSSSLTDSSDPSEWQFQGSNNGSSWTTLDTQAAQTFSARKQPKRYSFTNLTPYRFHRLNVIATLGGTSGVALAEFQLWNADTDGIGSVSIGTTDQGAAQAFDGNIGTKWFSGSGNTGWIQYFFGGGAARKLASYKITSANDVPDRDPKNWQFQGSNNGTSWVTLETKSDQIFTGRFQTLTYPLSSNSPYRYHRLNVTANFGPAGNSSGIQLAELTLIEATSPPLAPANPVLSVVDGKVLLNWAAGSGTTGFNVKRSTTPGGPYVTIASGLGGTGFTDESAAPGTSYYYIVTGTNNSGESPASAEATTAGLAGVPAPPIGVNAGGGDLAVRLEWFASPGATSYTVKRSPWSGGPFTPVATVTTNNHNDAGLTNGTTWYYTISATGPGGESAGSIQVSATPQASATPHGLPFLHPLFANDGILQRDVTLPVWGWTTPGSQVTVSIHSETITATANASGRWQVQVGPFAAGGPHTLVVSGPQSVTATNLMFGDVFLFSGQSNMERQLGPRPPQPDVLNYQAEASAANFPNIRQFSIPLSTGATARQVPSGSWSVCGPATVQNFSAVGYFTARRLFQATNVPVGIIHSAYGGTRIDPWLEHLEAARIPEYTRSVNTLPGAASVNAELPGGIFNTMIAPLAPFRVKGAFWYQGESSADRPEQYSRMLPALMTGWRRAFGDPQLPFVIIQLPDFSSAVGTPVQTGSWAELREAQFSSAVNDSRTRLVTAIDLGDADIHPPNKQDVGARAALAALDVAYGQTLVSQGPLFTGATVEGATIRCTFSNVGAGLMVGSKANLVPTAEVVGGTLTGFAIAGADKVWVAANAVISGNTVVVSGVASPLYVRYGWANMPACNLYNKVTNVGGTVIDGLPASPFRNDPLARLNVMNGSGSNTYAPGSTIPVTANAYTGGVFSFWSGDTNSLANPGSATTTASLGRSYVSIGGNYQLVFAPAAFTATAASLSVVLNWTALNDATSYTIKRAPASGGPFTTVASGILANTWTDNTTGFGTPYFYRISARNPAGDGPETTATVTATAEPPGPPTSFIAAPGNGLAILSWNPVGNAQGYTLARSTVNGGPYFPIVSRTPGTHHVDTGLSNGTTYYYTVASLVSGSTGPAATASATPSSSSAPLLRSIGGTASASVENGTAESAANAFDGKFLSTNATKWFTAFVAMPQWLQYQFAPGTAWALNSYAIVSANDSNGRDPMDWQFQGSFDGTTWTTLDTRTGESFNARFLSKSYTFSNTTTYPRYRLLVSAVQGGGISGLQISELRLFSPPTDQGDKTPPVFGPTGNLSFDADSPSGKPVGFFFIATDAVSGTILPESTPASGSLFPVGTTTVNSTATDLAGNQATTAFTVTIAPFGQPFSFPPAFTLNSGSAQISLNATPGYSYRLQRSYTLATESWQNIGPVQSGGGILSFSDTPAPPDGKAFYRLITVDP